MKPGDIRFIANRLSKSAKSGKQNVISSDKHLEKIKNNKLNTDTNGSFLNFARLTAFISVMLGSIALIISLSVLNGFEKMLFNKAVNFTSHINIKTLNRKPIPDKQKIAGTLASRFRNIKQIFPVIERESLIRTDAFVEGIVLKGIEKDYFDIMIKKNILYGNKSFSDNSNSLIIGKRLADKLGIRLGSDVIIYALKEGDIITGNRPTGKPEPHIDKFKIAGIYETGMAQYDDIITYMPFNEASDFLNIRRDEATGYEIWLRDISKINSIANSIELILRYPFYVLTVYELHSAIFAWISLQKEPIPLVLGLITIVAVLNIITTLLITVVEKTHSIGILRSLGMKNKDIVSIFVLQGVWIGLLGTLIGSAIGFIVCWIQQEYGIIRLDGNIYFLDKLPVQISLWHYQIVIGMSILFSFLATLIPSLIAVKIQPIRVLRFK